MTLYNRSQPYTCLEAVEYQVTRAQPPQSYFLSPLKRTAHSFSGDCRVCTSIGTWHEDQVCTCACVPLSMILFSKSSRRRVKASRLAFNSLLCMYNGCASLANSVTAANMGGDCREVLIKAIKWEICVDTG